jgi:hypothetical protein
MKLSVTSNYSALQLPRFSPYHFPEDPLPSSLIHSGPKDGLDLVSPQFGETHNLEDSALPFLISGRPKGEVPDPVQL